MHFEFQRANAVGDALDIIAQAMGEIIHRIDAPFGAGVVMFGVADAIEQRVAQPDIGRAHVNFGAQGARCRRGTRRLSSAEKRSRLSATRRSRKGLSVLAGSARRGIGRCPPAERSQT